MNGMEESIKHQRLADQFINQYENTIKEGGYKNAFGRLVAMGIDIKGKNNGIGQQRNAADGGKQGLICFQKKKIIRKTKGAGKIPEIINQHGEQGRKDAQHDA